MSTVRVRAATGYRLLVGAVRRLVEQGAPPADEDLREVANLPVMSLRGVVSMLIARPGLAGGWSA